MSIVSAFPLSWPVNRDRIKSTEPTPYSVSLATAREHLLKQLELLGAKNVVISSNAVLRKDGLPAARQPKIADTGVAVWFCWPTVQSVDYCISCDQYDSIMGNLRAIGLSVADIRSLSRRLNVPLIRMFVAQPPQQQKPPPKQEKQQQKRQPPPPRPEAEKVESWQKVLGLSGAITETTVKARYRELAKVHHPDMGGNTATFQKIQAAYEQAKKHFKFK